MDMGVGMNRAGRDTSTAQQVERGREGGREKERITQENNNCLLQTTNLQ